MQIKKGYIVKKVAGSYMIISTGVITDVNRMQTINETGAFLWELLKTPKTKEELVAALLNEYETDEKTAAKDVDAFTAKLSKAELLDD